NGNIRIVGVIYGELQIKLPKGMRLLYTDGSSQFNHHGYSFVEIENEHGISNCAWQSIENSSDWRFATEDFAGIGAVYNLGDVDYNIINLDYEALMKNTENWWYTCVPVHPDRFFKNPD